MDDRALIKKTNTKISPPNFVEIVRFDDFHSKNFLFLGAFKWC